jgi:hypothetical protein
MLDLILWASELTFTGLLTSVFFSSVVCEVTLTLGPPQVKTLPKKPGPSEDFVVSFGASIVFVFSSLGSTSGSGTKVVVNSAKTARSKFSKGSFTIDLRKLFSSIVMQPWKIYLIVFNDFILYSSAASGSPNVSAMNYSRAGPRLLSFFEKGLWRKIDGKLFNSDWVLLSSIKVHLFNILATRSSSSFTLFIN